MNSKYKYLILLYLTTLNVLSFIDRQLLVSFSNFIVPDLGLSNTQFGILTGLAFIIFYSVMGVMMGAIADRIHRPKFMAIGVALWSLLTAATGMAKSFWMLLIPRIFIGVGESILTPTAISYMSDYFPRRNMGFVAGFYYIAVPLGVALSFFIAGYLGPIWGWRNCFYALGAFGLIMALFTYFFRESDNRIEQLSLTGGGLSINIDAIKESFHELRKIIKANPSLRLTIYGGIAVNFILGATVFDQLWLVNDKGFDRAEILLVTGAIGLPAGIMGNLFGGIGSDYYVRKTGKGRQIFLFWCMLIFTPFILLYRLTDDTGTLFFTLMFLGFFQWGTLYGPITSAVQEMAPEKHKAVVLAYYIFMVNLIGLGFSTTMAGVMIDALIAYDIDNPYSVTIITFQVLATACLPLFYFAGKRRSIN
ncbi:MAG TPA: MFS transporter [Gammaproteobacteria bacterium]|jgi:MFS family permease|nr:hypothetical protein [Gammaproteobacteria bacterium]HJM08966.1 MFS transporter [Gammaproteobacteria bacterium]HJN00071.1 MFS transporter [Gammaproteobacteria bacterium]|tara:strand:+ start:2066 stop:3325 length:1260 start_codon:yes stop_codon:yes gene_type:complete